MQRARLQVAIAHYRWAVPAIPTSDSRRPSAGQRTCIPETLSNEDALVLEASLQKKSESKSHALLIVGEGIPSLACLFLCVTRGGREAVTYEWVSVRKKCEKNPRKVPRTVYRIEAGPSSLVPVPPRTQRRTAADGVHRHPGAVSTSVWIFCFVAATKTPL
jgi:hypothetical protein